MRVYIWRNISIGCFIKLIVLRNLVLCLNMEVRIFLYLIVFMICFKKFNGLSGLSLRSGCVVYMV